MKEYLRNDALIQKQTEKYSKISTDLKALDSQISEPQDLISIFDIMSCHVAQRTVNC